MELEEECNFNTKAENVKFTTQVNGDMLLISNLHFTKEQASTLAWLVNHANKILVFEVKLQE